MIKLKDLVSIIKENGAEAAGGGQSGQLNYGQQYGTIGGGNYTQNPTKFSSSDKTTNHFEPNTTSGSALVSGNNQPYRPDNIMSTSKNVISPEKQTKNVVSPAANADIQQSQKPLDPNKQYDPQVDALFKKKDTPTPDQILQGMQTELGKMVKKDKAIAKQIVLKNLRKSPNYYSSLQDLNIDDEKMTVDENNKEKINDMINENYNPKLTDQSTYEKTKKLLDVMVDENRKQKNRPVENSPEITQIFKDLVDKRQSNRRSLNG